MAHSRIPLLHTSEQRVVVHKKIKHFSFFLERERERGETRHRRTIELVKMLYLFLTNVKLNWNNIIPNKDKLKNRNGFKHLESTRQREIRPTFCRNFIALTFDMYRNVKKGELALPNRIMDHAT